MPIKPIPTEYQRLIDEAFRRGQRLARQEREPSPLRMLGLALLAVGITVVVWILLGVL
jgi:uncharacterized protein YjeT (DUF2065 family)